MAEKSIQKADFWFWDDEFWLPPNVTWKDLKARQGVSYAAFGDLAYPLLFAWVILLLRKLVEKCIFRPIGIKIGMKSQGHPDPGPPNLTIQRNKSRGTLTYEEERILELWMKKKKKFEKPTKLDKFSETGWRWMYYSAIFAFGLVSLWSKSWFWDISDCWTNYPHHSMDHDVWWYYITELSFYWGLFFSQFIDVRRKDFWVMFVHHVTTILLMCFSWTCNFFKVGTLVLLLHDCADIFLETAKLLKYSGLRKISEIFFGGFAVTWIITRLGIFPYWIIYSVAVEAPQHMQYFPAYYVFNALLSLLLVLNIGWCYFIIKVAYLAIFTNVSIANDSRSDDSSSESDDEGPTEQKESKKLQ